MRINGSLTLQKMQGALGSLSKAKLKGELVPQIKSCEYFADLIECTMLYIHELHSAVSVTNWRTPCVI